jgi:hypothetical protein
MIILTYLTGLEIVANFSSYLLYGYTTPLVFTGIALFGYIGVETINMTYMRVYMLLSMTVSFMRILEFMYLLQFEHARSLYSLPFMNVYTMIVCFYMNKYMYQNSIRFIENDKSHIEIDIEDEYRRSDYKNTSLQTCDGKGYPCKA